MNLDVAHAIVDGVVVFAIIIALEFMGRASGWSRSRKALTMGALAFFAVLVVHMLWTGGTAPA